MAGMEYPIIIPVLDWAGWNSKSAYRGVDKKYLDLLEPLLFDYPAKIDRLYKRLLELEEQYEVFIKNGKLKQKDLEDVDEYIFLKIKIDRLADKYLTVQKEKEGRDLGIFKRTELHHTDYFIDLDAGNDANTGLSIAQSWLTLAKYTTTTARTAGDRAFVRANTSEVMGASLAFDENGNQDNLIQIIGCDSVINDPWTDGSDVKPTLSFGDGNFSAIPAGDSFWKISRLGIKESGSNNGNIYFSGNSNYWHLYQCELYDCSGGSGVGSKILQSLVTYEECAFLNNINVNLSVSYGGKAKAIKCTFDKGTATSIGLRVDYNAEVECVECDFSQTTLHSGFDVQIDDTAVVWLRACKYEIAPNIQIPGGAIFMEDTDGVYGAFLATYYQGTIELDTTVKTGAATFSIKILPNANCGINNPITLDNQSIIKFPFNIQCTTDIEKTITVKIRAVGTWGTYPTAAELYIEFLYLNHAVNATRTSIKSTQVLSHASDWVDFTVTFTPLQTGIAYGRVVMGAYEDVGDGIYTNGEAT